MEELKKLLGCFFMEENTGSWKWDMTWASTLTWQHHGLLKNRLVCARLLLVPITQHWDSGLPFTPHHYSPARSSATSCSSAADSDFVLQISTLLLGPGDQGEGWMFVGDIFRWMGIDLDRQELECKALFFRSVKKSRHSLSLGCFSSFFLPDTTVAD